MGLAIAAAYKGHPIESLATAPERGMAIALRWSRAVCSSLLCPCQGAAQIWLAEQLVFYLRHSRVDFFCRPKFCGVGK